MAHTTIVESLGCILLSCPVMIMQFQSEIISVFGLYLPSLYELSSLLSAYSKWRWVLKWRSSLIHFHLSSDWVYIEIYIILSLLCFSSWRKRDIWRDKADQTLLDQWSTTIIFWISTFPFHLYCLKHRMQKFLKKKKNA